MEDRIIELEMAVAHQQKFIDDLNDVVIEQGKEIAKLKKSLILMKDSMDQQLVKSLEDETPPPHY